MEDERSIQAKDGNLIVTSPDIELVIDLENGGIRRLTNRRTGDTLVEVSSAPPWRLRAQGASPIGSILLPIFPDVTIDHIEPAELAYELEDVEATLRWSTDQPGVTVEVRIGFDAHDGIELRPRVLNDGTSRPPEALTYPILRQPQRLSADGATDRLAFPAHSGWLVTDPLGMGRPYEAQYPDGYDGCSMQVIAFYKQGVGGFYLASHDPHSTHKVFRFANDEASIRHDAWDLSPGASMELEYAIVIGPLTRGDWYEAAERYRAWALTETPWSARGPKWGRTDTEFARWLHEDVGLCIWGGPSSVDWAPFYRAYAQAAGTPLHIVAGWDWPGSRPHHVGYEGWFPARFHPNNLEAWKEHRVTPYMNDLFISFRAEDFMATWEPNLMFPYQQFPFTLFSEPSPDWVAGEGPAPDPDVVMDVAFFLCPVTQAQQELHTWRDLTLVRDYDLDGIAYDISSGNPRARCLRRDHGHPPGWGRHLIEAYDRNNRLSKEAIRRETGRYAAQGVECIIENVIGWVDFYISRACAGPMGALESFTLGPELPPGMGKELIPFFQAVYHDYGPVHQDGWAQVSARYGELFYWIASRIVLQWGGELALEYAINRPERFPETEGPATMALWDGGFYEFSDLPEVDHSKLAFLREIALARTGYGNRYLGYGQIVRPVGVASDSVTLDYLMANDNMHPGRGVRKQGVWVVSRVLEAAWKDPSGNLGLFFVNLHGTEPTTVEIDVDLHEQWGLHAEGRAVQIVRADDSSALEPVPENNRLKQSIALPPRTIILLEVLAGESK